MTQAPRETIETFGPTNPNTYRELKGRPIDWPAEETKARARGHTILQHWEERLPRYSEDWFSREERRL